MALNFKEGNWRSTLQNSFRWFLVTVAAIVIVIIIAAMIYDRLSGFDKGEVLRTGVIESLGNTGHGEWLNQTSLYVRLDDGVVIHVTAPEAFFIRIGGKVLVSERISKAFRTKRYLFIKQLD